MDFLIYNSVPSPVVTGLRVEFNSVPEPSTLVLLSIGAIGLLGFAWRRRKPIGRPQRLSLQPAASQAISLSPSDTPLQAGRTHANRRVLQLVLAVVSPVMFGWLANVSSAQITQGPVTDLWNTGVSNSGVPLPNATVGDPHYTLVAVPSGSSPTLVVATSAGGPPIVAGGWLDNDSLSAWIGPNYRAANTPPGSLQFPSLLELRLPNDLHAFRGGLLHHYRAMVRGQPRLRYPLGRQFHGRFHVAFY